MRAKSAHAARGAGVGAQAREGRNGKKKGEATTASPANNGNGSSNGHGTNGKDAAATAPGVEPVVQCVSPRQALFNSVTPEMLTNAMSVITAYLTDVRHKGLTTGHHLVPDRLDMRIQILEEMDHPKRLETLKLISEDLLKERFAVLAAYLSSPKHPNAKSRAVELIANAVVLRVRLLEDVASRPRKPRPPRKPPAPRKSEEAPIDKEPEKDKAPIDPPKDEPKDKKPIGGDEASKSPTPDKKPDDSKDEASDEKAEPPKDDKSKGDTSPDDVLKSINERLKRIENPWWARALRFIGDVVKTWF